MWTTWLQLILEPSAKRRIANKTKLCNKSISTIRGCACICGTAPMFINPVRNGSFLFTVAQILRYGSPHGKAQRRSPGIPADGNRQLGWIFYGLRFGLLFGLPSPRAVWLIPISNTNVSIAHFMGNSSGCTRVQKRVEDETAWVGNDMNNAFNQWARFR